MSEIISLPDLDGVPVVEAQEGDEAPDAAHIVTQQDLMQSQITGQAIRALCGKMWVPKRNPDDFPLCQSCVDILNAAGPAPGR